MYTFIYFLYIKNLQKINYKIYLHKNLNLIKRKEWNIISIYRI